MTADSLYRQLGEQCSTHRNDQHRSSVHVICGNPMARREQDSITVCAATSESNVFPHVLSVYFAAASRELTCCSLARKRSIAETRTIL
jgi:uncharacterized protein (DUF1810 family)